MDLQLKGQVAVVTGGAQGIGAGISKMLAAEGVNIVINDFCSLEISEPFAKSLEETYGVRAVAVQGDVTKPENAENVLSVCLNTFGGVDILVNNAGAGGRRCEFEELTYEDWKRVQDLNLNGAFLMCSCFIKYWKRNSRAGHIVNTISKAAFMSNSTGNDAYVSAKAGLMGLTRALAKGNASHNIWVNGIVPGYVFNSRLQNREAGLASGNKRYETVMGDGHLPLGEFASPEDMGAVVAFLCSPKAKQICGTAIDCTGGTLV